jgi:hypothetical protein
MPELGFTPPDRRHPLGDERKVAALASLVASLTLVVAILLVSFAVTGSEHGFSAANAGWVNTPRG